MIRRTTKEQKARFEQRYDNEHWMGIKKLAHATTGKRCCCCLAECSEEIHHVRYSDEQGAIAGREVPGIDVFPICERCHDSIAHAKEHWIRSSHRPDLNNRNTDEFVSFLKVNWKLLSDGGIKN